MNAVQSKTCHILIVWLLLGGMLLVSGFSVAHTPYLLPNRFEPLDNGLVTLDASFAERFFVPEVAFDNDNFSVTTPDGNVVKPDAMHEFKSRMVLEHKLEQDGTYRFSTGRRYGAIFTTYEENGEQRNSRNPNFELPKGAKLIEKFQAVTLAETYVTKGGPSKKALIPRNKGLEIVPQTHPNDLFVGDDFNFQLLFEGKPLAGAGVDIFLAAYQFSVEKPDAQLTTNAKGMTSFSPKKEGVYLLQVRHKAPAPLESPAPFYSNTYTLVIEAFN